MQKEYNEAHGITPETIRKSIRMGIEADAAAHASSYAVVGRSEETQYITEEYLAELETEMLAAAEELEFERAAAIRDRIAQMRKQMGKPLAEAEIRHSTRAERRSHRKSALAQTRSAAETSLSSFPLPPSSESNSCSVNPHERNTTSRFPCWASPFGSTRCSG